MKAPHACWLLAATFHLSASDHAAAASIVFGQPTGNWNLASNWAQNQVPGNADTAFIRANRTATLDQSQADVVNVYLGEDNAGGTLLFNSGGSLNVNGNFEVMRRGSFTNISGTFTMTGGTLGVTGSGILYVGSGGATTTGISSGTATFSGTSTFSGNIAIGATSTGSSLGYFNVIGSTAVIGDGGVAKNFSLNRYGTLGFTLGATGASTLNFSQSIVALASGSRMVIDGSAYTGGAGDIVLINGGSLTGTSGVTISGLDGFTSSIVYNEGSSGDVVLRLSNIPEPGVSLLAAAGLLLGMRRRGARGLA